MNLQQKLISVVVALVMLSPGQVLAQAEETPPPELPTISAENWMLNLEMRRGQRLGSFGSNMYAEMMIMQGAAQIFGNVPGMQDGGCAARCLFHEIVNVQLADGSTMKASHLLSMLEVMARAGIADAGMFDAMGTGYAIMQDTMAENAEEGLGEFGPLAKFAFGDISVSTSQVMQDAKNKSWEVEDETDPNWVAEREAPWLNPFRLFGAGAGMMFETADAIDEANATQMQDAAQEQVAANQKLALAEQMRVVGTTEISGRPAVHLSLSAADVASLMAPDSGIESWQLMAALSPLGLITAAVTAKEPDNALFWYEQDGQRVVFHQFDLWIDTQEVVLLKHRADGTMSGGGETRDFFIEGVNEDFRNPPGCGDMLEPYRRVTRMGGMLDKAQMAELKEAQAKLEEFEQQMAEMPADQRAMVESMMGGQMDMLRSMANGGAFEQVQEVEKIICNPDIKALLTIQMPGELPNELVQIQLNLVRLGYEPGNTDGILDALTQVAISQYQAEHGMAVTGEPSSALASRLAAEAS